MHAPLPDRSLHRRRPSATPQARDHAAEFVAAAFAMREKAVAAGDQAYGAVVVRDGEIVG